MIYLEAIKTIKCNECKGRGYYLLEGYEYICSYCKGTKRIKKKVLMDIETFHINHIFYYHHRGKTETFHQEKMYSPN